MGKESLKMLFYLKKKIFSFLFAFSSSFYTYYGWFAVYAVAFNSFILRFIKKKNEKYVMLLKRTRRRGKRNIMFIFSFHFWMDSVQFGRSSFPPLCSCAFCVCCLPKGYRTIEICIYDFHCTIECSCSSHRIQLHHVTWAMQSRVIELLMRALASLKPLRLSTWNARAKTVTPQSSANN